MDYKEKLFELCKTTGVVGHEEERGKLIMSHFKTYCEEVWVNNTNNVIGLKKGKGKCKVMVSAHMDEIGLMISNIDKNGLLAVTGLGGFDPRTLVSQSVLIFCNKKDGDNTLIKGVIGSKSKHLISLEDSKKAVRLEDLRIDTGLTFTEISKLVEIGNIAVIDKEPTELLNDRISSPAMDDLIGIISMYYALEYLKNYNHDADIYFVASTQEEVGCRGSITATEEVKPDIGLAVDVTFANTPELTMIDTLLGEGPTITYSPGDNRKVVKELIRLSKDNNIKYQVTVTPSPRGTEVFSMQVGGCGTATANIGIPLRYMHTSVETIDMNDVKEAGRLIASYIVSLNDVDMEEYLCY